MTQETTPRADMKVFRVGINGLEEGRELSLEEELEELFESYGTGDEVQAVAEDLRADKLEMCPCCVIGFVQALQRDQKRLRRRYGAAWHGGLHMRRLRRAVATGYPRGSAEDRELVADYVAWSVGKGFARQHGANNLRWVEG